MTAPEDDIVRWWFREFEYEERLVLAHAVTHGGYVPVDRRSPAAASLRAGVKALRRRTPPLVAQVDAPPGQPCISRLFWVQVDPVTLGRVEAFQVMRSLDILRDNI